MRETREQPQHNHPRKTKHQASLLVHLLRWLAGGVQGVGEWGVRSEGMKWRVGEGVDWRVNEHLTTREESLCGIANALREHAKRPKRGGGEFWITIPLVYGFRNYSKTSYMCTMVKGREACHLYSRYQCSQSDVVSIFGCPDKIASKLCWNCAVRCFALHTGKKWAWGSWCFMVEGWKAPFYWNTTVRSVMCDVSIFGAPYKIDLENMLKRRRMMLSVLPRRFAPRLSYSSF